MDPKSFEELICQSESEWLDFKRDQYRFVGVKDEYVRSELLKDILAFVNTGRDRDAFILIGVKKLPGGKCELSGIDPQGRPADHLDDAAVQQFVNEKTNETVNFAYEAFEYEGKTYGAFRIPAHDISADGFRYVEDDYGRVKKFQVFVRRGTSTAVLTPNEVLRFGQASVTKPTPNLKVELLDPRTHAALGERVVYETENLHFPTDIPKVQQPVQRGRIGNLEVAMPWNQDPFLNENCLRDIARYTEFVAGFRAFEVRIRNDGYEHATGFRLELAAQGNDVSLVRLDNMPESPKVRRNLNIYPNLPNVLREVPGTLTVQRDRPSGGLRVTSTEINIQPGRGVTLTPPLCIGSRADAVARLEGHLFGDNLRQPVPVSFEFELRVKERELTLPELWRVYESLKAGV